MTIQTGGMSVGIGGRMAGPGFGYVVAVVQLASLGRCGAGLENIPSPMKDVKIQQGKMCGMVDRFTTDRATDLALVPAAVEEGADVRAAYLLFTKATGTPVVQTQEVTEKAEAAREQLRTMLPALLGPLSSVATKATDVDLLARSTLKARQLERLSDTELSTLANDLITLGEDQPTAVKTKYALPLILPILRGYQTDFAPLVGQTQGIIDGRSSDNRTADQLLKATMQQIYELDKVMKIFKILNPGLYKDYRAARRIGKRSGSSKKKGKGGAAPQA